MFYIIFLFYLLMLLAVAIAKDCSGGFRSSSESDEIMRMEYEQKYKKSDVKQKDYKKKTRG